VVVQGHDHPLLSRAVVHASDVHWIAGAPPRLPGRFAAKTRYRMADAPCTVDATRDGSLEMASVRVRLRRSAPATSVSVMRTVPAPLPNRAPAGTESREWMPISPRLTSSLVEALTWTAQPPAGTSMGAAIWAGAMHQSIQQTVAGSVANTDLQFIVVQSPTKPWNALLGGLVEFGKNGYVLLEGGFGDRTSILAAAVYRF